LGRNGLINSLFEDFKSVDKESKGKAGLALNNLKVSIQKIYEEKKSYFSSDNKTSEPEIDLTLPGRVHNKGTKHLINQAIDEISGIFRCIEYTRLPSVKRYAGYLLC
jgi:phenylalanyl-tRNA synthetase alpha chain